MYRKCLIKGKIIFVVCYNYFSDSETTKKSLPQNNKPDIYLYYLYNFQWTNEALRPYFNIITNEQIL